MPLGPPTVGGEGIKTRRNNRPWLTNGDGSESLMVRKFGLTVRLD